MTFGEAINLLREGKAATRTSWNGKNMFILLVNGCMLPVEEGSQLAHFVPVGTTVECPSQIAMFNAQRTLIPWVASQTDMLAGDWEECLGVLWEWSVEKSPRRALKTGNRGHGYLDTN